MRSPVLAYSPIQETVAELRADCVNFERLIESLFDEIERLNFSGVVRVEGTGEDDLLVLDATGPDRRRPVGFTWCGCGVTAAPRRGRGSRWRGERPPLEPATPCPDPVTTSRFPPPVRFRIVQTPLVHAR